MNKIENQELYRQMLMLMIRAKRHLAKGLEEKSLTPAQGLLILCLEPDKEYSMHALADIFGCDASNITGLVEKLERQGIVTRRADKRDRRIKRIELSEDGRQCRDYIIDQVEKAELGDMEKLTPEERLKLMELIGKLTS